MEEEVQAKRSYWYRDFIKQKITSVQPTLFEKLKPGKNSLNFKSPIPFKKFYLFSYVFCEVVIEIR